MVTIVCIDDRNLKTIKLNGKYKAYEKDTHYLIPFKENNMEEVSKNYIRGFVKIKKHRFVKL